MRDFNLPVDGFLSTVSNSGKFVSNRIWFIHLSVVSKDTFSSVVNGLSSSGNTTYSIISIQYIDLI